MDPITLTAGIAGIAGLGLGASVVGIIMGSKLEELRERIASRDAAIEGHRLRIAEQDDELNKLGTRCSELRIENRDKDQANEKLVRRIAELEPDAERGRTARLQSRRALEKAQEANRARQAAKAGGNVTPIAKPNRKRA